MCNPQSKSMCFDGGRKRERAKDIERNIKRSRSAVRPQLEWRATPVSARGPLPRSLSLPRSVVFLPLSFCPAGRAGASQPPTHPPPPRSRPVQPSHAWPSLGIHSGCFLFIASTPPFLSHSLSLSLQLLSICHSTPTMLHLHVFLFTSCPINHLYFLTQAQVCIFFNIDCTFIDWCRVWQHFSFNVRIQLQCSDQTKSDFF